MASTLSGPAYQIPVSLGQTRSGNLFHSFASFNLLAGESAFFEGSGFSNVISRVTGGTPSGIYGSLKSGMSGTAFWFINPAGVIFGPGASVHELGGAFHASTAHYLKLGASGRFEAANPGASSLTVDAPSAFGFNGPAGAISVSQANLQVPAGNAISLVGGNVLLDAAQLHAPGGRINLASASGAAEIMLDAAGIGASGMASGLIQASGGLIRTGAVAGTGPVYIRGGRLQMAGVEIDTENKVAGPGGNVEIALPGGEFTMAGGMIKALSSGPGDGGNIVIAAGAATLSNAASLSVSVTSEGTGKAGHIEAAVDGDAALLSGSKLFANTYLGDAQAGRITLTAGNLLVSGASSVSAVTEGDGAGGSIVVTAGNVRLNSGGKLDASTVYRDRAVPGSGAGGSIKVTAAQSVEIAGTGSGLISRTTSIGAGGAIEVRAHDIVLRDGGSIRADSVENIGVAVGDAGAIHLVASGSLRLENGAAISTTSNTAGGGKITIEVRDTILVRSSRITTSGSSRFVGDDAGDIFIDPVFVILAGATIDTSGFVGNAGSVTINTQHFLMSPDSVLDSSSTFGQAGLQQISAPDAETPKALAVLSAAFTDDAMRVSESCSARAARGSTLVTGGRGGVPAGPSAMGFSPYAFAPAGEAPLRVAAASVLRTCVN